MTTPRSDRVARVLGVLTHCTAGWWQERLESKVLVQATTAARGLRYGKWGCWPGTNVGYPQTEIRWRVESIQAGLEALAAADLFPVEWCSPSARRFLCPGCPRATPRGLDDASPCEACGAKLPAVGEVEAWADTPPTYAELLGWATLDPQDFRRYEALVEAAWRELVKGPLPRILWRFVGSWRVYDSYAPHLSGSPQGVYADGVRYDPGRTRYARYIGDFGALDPPPEPIGSVLALETLWNAKVVVRSLHEGLWAEAEILNPFDGFADPSRWNYPRIAEGLTLRGVLR